MLSDNYNNLESDLTNKIKDWVIKVEEYSGKDCTKEEDKDARCPQRYYPISTPELQKLLENYSHIHCRKGKDCCPEGELERIFCKSGIFSKVLVFGEHPESGIYELLAYLGKLENEGKSLENKFDGFLLPEIQTLEGIYGKGGIRYIGKKSLFGRIRKSLSEKGETDGSVELLIKPEKYMKASVTINGETKEMKKIFKGQWCIPYVKQFDKKTKSYFLILAFLTEEYTKQLQTLTNNKEQDKISKFIQEEIEKDLFYSYIFPHLLSLRPKESYGKLPSFLSEKNRQNLCIFLRKVFREPNFFWYGNRCPFLVDHTFNHSNNMWKMANDLILEPRPSFISTDNSLLAFALSIWLHDIGHSGTDLVQEEYEVRDAHGILSAELILYKRKLYQISSFNKKVIIPTALICAYHQNNTPIYTADRDRILNERPIPPELDANVATMLSHNSRMGHFIKMLKDRNIEIKETGHRVPLEKIELPRAYNIKTQDIISLTSLLRILDALDMNKNRVGPRKVKEDATRRIVQYRWNTLYMAITKNTIPRSLTSAKKKSFLNACEGLSFPQNTKDSKKKIDKIRDFASNNDMNINNKMDRIKTFLYNIGLFNQQPKYYYVHDKVEDFNLNKENGIWCLSYYIKIENEGDIKKIIKMIHDEIEKEANLYNNLLKDIYPIKIKLIDFISDKVKKEIDMAKVAEAFVKKGSDE